MRDHLAKPLRPKLRRSPAHDYILHGGIAKVRAGALDADDVALTAVIETHGGGPAKPLVCVAVEHDVGCRAQGNVKPAFALSPGAVASISFDLKALVGLVYDSDILAVATPLARGKAGPEDQYIALLSIELWTAAAHQLGDLAPAVEIEVMID